MIASMADKALGALAKLQGKNACLWLCHAAEAPEELFK